ncbi:hypothetical protein Zmor_008959 [Zophobas morio]|uniref:Uncharacterized protein n=1 Tax=Zophobas morio TaxID=2755281 RepID=A0AA38HIF1_9CUCU|nr:hypothetical protein Zmor_008959 [Zophobas morio]
MVQLNNDLGIHVETKDASYGSGNTKIVSAPTPSPEYSNDAPSFDTKVTEPPKFGGFEEETATPEFSAPSFGAEGRPETFVVPTTVATEGLNQRRDRDKQFLQAALARAIRMD